MNTRIIYYSGTGSTRFVAKAFESELHANGITVQMQEIRKNIPIVNEPFDLLIICYAVYACNAPSIVIKWIKEQSSVDKIPVAVISVSGGGEVTPNLACRSYLKRELKKKNYNIVYEQMIVMPSNWIVATKKVLIDKLLEILPSKVEKIVSDLLKGKTRLTNPGIGNRIISLIGRIEKVGARKFGKCIKVSDKCNGCSICKIGCPVGNINIIEGIPKFENNCILCLNCLYSCPNKALTAGIGKFVLIKEGFKFSNIILDKSIVKEIDIIKETKGYLWLGVRRYLLNE